MKYGIVLMLVFPALSAWSDESDIIKADRQALVDAQNSGSSSKVLEAKEQLSDDLSVQAEQMRKDAQGVNVPLISDGQGHYAADVLINNKVHASLIVDTGSPVVMLTQAMARKLGLDLSGANTGYVEVLNGKYKAAAVSLDNVKVGDTQAQGVDAIVLFGNNNEVKDGLLGLSYLSKFHFTLDQRGQKLVLRKLE